MSCLTLSARCLVVFFFFLGFLSTLGHASPRVNKNRPVTRFGWLKDSIPDGENFIRSEEYNLGAYGQYVNRTFKTSDIIAPRLNFMKPFTECDDGSLLFVTPRGEIVDPAPYILDVNGSVVWTPDRKYGAVYNLQVQKYKGEDYITFWGGNSSVGGHGEGYHYMFDKHYQLFRKIGGVNGLAADLHSFQILENGHVLSSSYEKVNITGRTPWKSVTEEWMWDSLFQEFDLATGKLIFQWRASEFVPFVYSYTSKPVGKSIDKPWDWFHINSVEKDDDGNYLVSARHTRSILYIDGKTGEVLWFLGGKDNNFFDMTGLDCTSFVGQHDAHWDQGHKFITLFDNRADWEYEAEHVSKGTRLAIDLEEMTVTLDTSFVHPERIFGFSQGSYQTLPNGNVLLGYGYTAAFTEFSPNGTVLCDAYMQPKARFSSGDAQSYRNLKFNWIGIPLTQPNVMFLDNSVYISWLGSTETRSWLLQDSDAPTSGFSAVHQAPKTGFETRIEITEENPLAGTFAPLFPIRRYFRVAALDAGGEILATSAVLDLAPVLLDEDAGEAVDEHGHIVITAAEDALVISNPAAAAADDDWNEVLLLDADRVALLLQWQADAEDLRLAIALLCIAVLALYVLMRLFFRGRRPWWGVGHSSSSPPSRQLKRALREGNHQEAGVLRRMWWYVTGRHRGDSAGRKKLRFDPYVEVREDERRWYRQGDRRRSIS